MGSCAIHVYKYSVEAMLLQQCRELTIVILSIMPWLPTYMGQSFIRCNTSSPSRDIRPRIFWALYIQLFQKNPNRVRGKTGKINKRTLNKVIQKKPKKPLYQEEKMQEKSKQFLNTLWAIKPCGPPSRQPIRQGVILFFLNSKCIHKHHPPLARHFNLSSIVAPGWRAWNEQTSARGKCSRGSSVHSDSSR